jgi:hypothetical protein
MAKGSGMQSGMSTKCPPQMKKGDPKGASSYPSVDSNATRSATASTPKTLGPRDA